MTGRDEMRARCERDMSQRSSGRTVAADWEGLQPISHTSRTTGHYCKQYSQRSQEITLPYTAAGGPTDRHSAGTRQCVAMYLSSEPLQARARGSRGTSLEDFQFHFLHFHLHFSASTNHKMESLRVAGPASRLAVD